MAFKEIDPLTGKRKKSGGRVVGSMNAAKKLRLEAEMMVNDALIEMGKDPLTGRKLLSEVLNHPKTPFETRMQCAALLSGYETTPAENNTQYVAQMPPALPGETTRKFTKTNAGQ